MLLRRHKDRWRNEPFFDWTKGEFTISDGDEEIITAQSMEFRPIDEEVHEVARQQILSDAETTLSYRQVQQLVKLNQLGKATGKRDVLEKKLLTFFRRMGNLTKMTRWEMVNIRYNLAGDVEEAPSEDERSEYGYAEDKKIIERWGDETYQRENKKRSTNYKLSATNKT